MSADIENTILAAMIHKTRGTGVEWMGSEIARRAGYANNMAVFDATIGVMARNELIEGRRMPSHGRCAARGWTLTHTGALRAGGHSIG